MGIWTRIKPGIGQENELQSDGTGVLIRKTPDGTMTSCELPARWQPSACQEKKCALLAS